MSLNTGISQARTRHRDPARRARCAERSRGNQKRCTAAESRSSNNVSNASHAAALLLRSSAEALVALAFWRGAMVSLWVFGVISRPWVVVRHNCFV